jgi:hypothetical protein
MLTFPCAMLPITWHSIKEDRYGSIKVFPIISKYSFSKGILICRFELVRSQVAKGLRDMHAAVSHVGSHVHDAVDAPQPDGPSHSHTGGHRVAETNGWTQDCTLGGGICAIVAVHAPERSRSPATSWR